MTLPAAAVCAAALALAAAGPPAHAQQAARPALAPAPGRDLSPGQCVEPVPDGPAPSAERKWEPTGGAPGTGSLAGLLAAVAARHPALAAAESRTWASLQRTRDLLRRANPELEADLGGSGPFDEAVGGLEVSFPLRPAGEAEALRRAGAAERAVLTAECGVALAELLASAGGAYADLLAAADLAALAEQELEVARGFETHARRRAQLAMAGDLPVLRAELLVGEALARRDGARGEARSARARLNALLGSPIETAPPKEDGLRPDAGDRLEAELEWQRLTSIPAAALPGPEEPAAPQQAAAGRHTTGLPPPDTPAPALRAARARAAAALSRVDVVRAMRRPAPRVGLRGERDTGGEFKLFALAGLAIPLFDRGRHAVAAAEAEADAAAWDVAAESLAMAGDRAGAAATLASTLESLERLERDLLPRAERLEAAARANAEQGAAGFVLWLEARRSYLDLARGRVELRRQAARAALELRRASGRFEDLLEPPGDVRPAGRSP